MGDFLIFDAMRLQHRAMPPKSGTRVALDFVFMPRPMGMDMTIIFAGMNNSPVDPFSYSVPIDKTPFRKGVQTLVSNNDIAVTSFGKDALAAQYAALRTEVSNLRMNVSTLREDAGALRTSTSWRITAPLRRTVGMIKYVMSSATCKINPES